MPERTILRSCDPQVTINQGKLCGKFMTSKSGRHFSAFQGIPYAKPPVGELRFKPPQDPVGWEGTLSAKQEGPLCAQIDYFNGYKVIGGDDCLYLNVYTPNIVQNDRKLNVMVWIHSGGFIFGSGNTDSYGPEYLLDHDIILVTFNFRVGALGFLSLGIPEASGNCGMKDQVSALRWVQNNIANFGGNPDCVTIFGQGSGASSVHFHLLSHLSRGLFHRAILQSGTAYDAIAFSPDPANEARKLATKLGCKETSNSAILNFLKNVDVKQLRDFESTYTLKNENTPDFSIKFGPCVEPSGIKEIFLNEDPQIMMARGDIADIPIIIGCTMKDGFTSLTTAHKQRQNIMETNLSLFLPNLLGVKEDSSEFKDAWFKIRTFYLEKMPNDELECFITLISDVNFNIGSNQFVEQWATLNRSPLYYYQFSYAGGLSPLKYKYQDHYKGTAHGEERSYIFNETFYLKKVNESPSDRLTIDRMTKFWTNFANTANPTPDSSLGVIWDPVSPPSKGSNKMGMCYLDINSELNMNHTHLNAKRMEFWKKIIQECNQQKKIK